MKVEQIKKDLLTKIGQTITIKYNLGRNKFEKYDVILKKLYKHIFLVELKNTHVKSFSYSDIITKTIKIDY